MTDCCGPRPGKADVTLQVPDLSSSSSETQIKNALKKVGGVHGVEVDLESREIEVSYDSTDANISQIKKAIEKLGYTVKDY